MLKINNRFRVDADDHQFMLKEFSKVQDKESKNYGKETSNVIGYFTTIEGALSYLEKLLLRRAVNKKNYNLKTIVGEIRKIHEEVFHELKDETTNDN